MYPSICIVLVLKFFIACLLPFEASNKTRVARSNVSKGGISHIAKIFRAVYHIIWYCQNGAKKKKAIYLAWYAPLAFAVLKKVLVNSSEREDKSKKLKLWTQELNNEPGPHEKQPFELNQARINQEN